jgi:hypothetical protein
MMRPTVHPERCIFRDEASRHPNSALPRDYRDSDVWGKPAIPELTDEEVYLVGIERDFRDLNGRRMYIRVQANRGSQLRRIGAAEACIVCGMPALPGVTAFAHIHMRDLHLSPCNDATRVFCLCWHHHHGCYDQGYISTVELLRAEEIWIENRRRPKPHSRDIAMMKGVKAGEQLRHCVWTKRRAVRSATFDPDSGGPFHKWLLG